MAITTWNPSDKSSAIVLSNGNLSAASVGSPMQSVRSTASRSGGKIYFEITIPTEATNVAVGIANSSLVLNLSAGLGGDANGMGFYPVSPAQSLYAGGSGATLGAATSSPNNEVVYLALDLTNKLAWISTSIMRGLSAPWNGSFTANPSTNTGGQSVSGLGTGPWFICFNDSTGGALVTVATQASQFVGTMPTGFVAWDNTLSASPTFSLSAVASGTNGQQWSTSQKNANITLSNGNLTATNTSGSGTNHTVYAAEGKTTGKYYWEWTVGISSSSGPTFGIGNTSSPTTDNIWTGAQSDTLGWHANGNVYNLGNSVATWATFSTGARLCYALDLTNHLIWGRVGNGNWNNSGTANPATGTGGFTIPSAVYASPVVPGAGLTYNSTPADSVAAAFASGSWTYTAPSGFLSFDAATNSLTASPNFALHAAASFANAQSITATPHFALSCVASGISTQQSVVSASFALHAAGSVTQSQTASGSSSFGLTSASTLAAITSLTASPSFSLNAVGSGSASQTASGTPSFALHTAASGAQTQTATGNASFGLTSASILTPTTPLTASTGFALSASGGMTNGVSITAHPAFTLACGASMSQAQQGSGSASFALSGHCTAAQTMSASGSASFGLSCVATSAATILATISASFNLSAAAIASLSQVISANPHLTLNAAATATSAQTASGDAIINFHAASAAQNHQTLTASSDFALQASVELLMADPLTAAGVMNFSAQAVAESSMELSASPSFTLACSANASGSQEAIGQASFPLAAAISMPQSQTASATASLSLTADGTTSQTNGITADPTFNLQAVAISESTMGLSSAAYFTLSADGLVVRVPNTIHAAIPFILSANVLTVSVNSMSVETGFELDLNGRIRPHDHSRRKITFGPEKRTVRFGPEKRSLTFYQ